MPDFGTNVARLQEFSALLERGLSKVFMDDLPTHDQLYGTWLRTKTAEEWIEDELVTTGLGPMPEKGIGGPFTTDKPLISDPKDYELATYALAVVMEYELVRWDKYRVFTRIAKLLKRSGVDRKNITAYSILNNSLATSDPVYQTYSGEALCSTAHVLLRGGTGKNAPTTAADISYLGMQEAITDFDLLENEDGLFVMLSPSKVVTHPAKHWIAETILKSQYRPDNANMNYNTVKGKFALHGNSPYLTSQGPWWMLADKDELEISFRMGDDFQLRRSFDHGTWNNVFTAYCSFTVGVLHWQGIWGSAGT